jgi:deoxycytidine triphosphate deaminase
VIIQVKAPEGTVFHYGQDIPKAYLEEKVLREESLLIGPKCAVLGCSSEKITFPMGYFGLLQTKGSLARMFVSVNCCDGQIEGGFTGKITFEIVNHSNYTVAVQPLHPVAQLFVFKTSSRYANPYDGRYQGASCPTVQLPKDRRFADRSGK